MKIVGVCAVHRREKAVRVCIKRLLERQTVPLEMILVGDSAIERSLAEELGTYYVETTNFPLSAKWQKGVEFARAISPDALLFDESDFRQQLLPVLRNAKKQVNYHAWKASKLQECKQGLEKLLPFVDHEIEFLKNLNENGKIQAQHQI